MNIHKTYGPLVALVNGCLQKFLKSLRELEMEGPSQCIIKQILISIMLHGNGKVKKS